MCEITYDNLTIYLCIGCHEDLCACRRPVGKIELDLLLGSKESQKVEISRDTLLFAGTKAPSICYPNGPSSSTSSFTLSNALYEAL